MTESSLNSDRIFLVQNDRILSKDSEVADVCNSYFNDITKDLNLWKWLPEPLCPILSNPVFQAIAKYEDHPSILKIQSLFNIQSRFNFSTVDSETVHKLIMSLEVKKSTSGNINPKLLKLSSGFFSSSLLANSFNASLCEAKFPNSLKCASVTPILKKGDATCVKNYRPISILPTVSKIFEKIMATQLNAFFETRFSPLLYGFRKSHSTQHALLRLLHRWQSSLDNSKIVGTVLMDLSKAYDCLTHDLLIAKLAAYGVEYHSLFFIHDYPTGNKKLG